MQDTYRTDDERWQAVLLRTAAADGQFYYSVRTTGVYCRPTCPSRRPNRENVAFYPSADAAAQAGFRPCLRCHPQQVSSEARIVAQVQHLVQAADASPTLAKLSAAVGLSPYHLQRLFKRATGLSPKQYAASVRADRLKAQLKQGATVTNALYEAGYGSTQALYAQAQQQLGMTPGAYRRGGSGEEITYTCVDTAIGRMLIAATAKGICALRFGDDEPLVRELHAEFPRATFVQDQATLQPHINAVAEHLAGRNPAMTLPLDVNPTKFQEQVWAALRAIPFGQVRSYTEVAAMIGAPSAVRAVARACATNPVALAIPCHRVVRLNGDLSGYRWGIDRKATLLRQEKQQSSPSREG